MLIAGGVTLVVALPALQVQVIRCKIRSTLLVLSRWLLHRQQVNSQRRYNGPCDLVLDFEDVTDVAIERFRPKVLVGIRANELCSDSQFIAGLADTAFEDV